MANVTNTWQGTCEGVKERTSYLQESGKLADCQLVVWQGEERTGFNAHKLILSMASPVFAEKISALEENYVNASTPKHLVVKDVDPDILRRMLRYIYADEIQLDSVGVACALGRAAFKYKLDHLVTACVGYVRRPIVIENACCTYEFSKAINDTNLKNKSLKFICANTSKVLKDSSFVDIEISTLITICQQEDLNIEDEFELFNAVVAYSDASKMKNSIDDENSLIPLLIDAIRNIRFLTMSTEQLYKCKNKSKLLTKDNYSTILSKKTVLNQNINMPEGFSSVTVRRNKIEYDETDGDQQEVCKKQKYRCSRTIGSVNNVFGSPSGRVTFKVNEPVMLIGLEIPAKVWGGNFELHEIEWEIYVGKSNSGEFTTLVSFTKKCDVFYNRPFDAYFDEGVKIDSNQEYYIEVIYKTIGYYPETETPIEETLNGDITVQWQNNNEYNINPGLIRGLIFEK